MRTTRRPARAAVTARLAIVVDFPSSWVALTTIMERNCLSTPTRSRFALSIRNGSAAAPSGSASITSLFFLRTLGGASGSRPRSGSSRSAAISRAERGRVSIAFHTSAMPIPSISPMTAATKTVTDDVGLGSGCAAGGPDHHSVGCLQCQKDSQLFALAGELLVDGRRFLPGRREILQAPFHSTAGATQRRGIERFAVPHELTRICIDKAPGTGRRTVIDDELDEIGVRATMSRSIDRETLRIDIGTFAVCKVALTTAGTPSEVGLRL